MKPRIRVSFALVLSLAASSAWAHHSFAPFDLTKRVMLTGTLTKVDWRNPHIQISIEVKGDQGQTESWSMESDAPGNLKERGINKDRFQKAVGQILTVQASLARDGSRHGHMFKITFPDGTTAP